MIKTCKHHVNGLSYQPVEFVVTYAGETCPVCEMLAESAAEVNDLESSCAEAEDESEGYLDEIENLKEQLQAAEDEKDRLRGELDSIENSFDDLIG